MIAAAPALSNDGSILYVAMDDSLWLLPGRGERRQHDSHEFGRLTVPNSDTAYFINESTASPMVAPDGTVFMGVLQQ